jgi:beta-glucanase (GH16 family)
MNFAEAFHTYGLEWNEHEIVFYFDDQEIRREKNEFCYSEVPIWLSLAVIPWAGQVTDAIDGTRMQVDWVRYYHKKER